MRKLKTAVFRAKTHARWEDCEIVDTLNDVTIIEADKRAWQLSEIYNKPIRWNWIGCFQGHYFGGKSYAKN